MKYMKRKFIAVAALAALATGNAFADEGLANITFNSEVSNATCVLDVSGHSIASIIPDVTGAALNAATGETIVSQSPDFTLSFTACPAGVTNISVTDVATTGTTSATNAALYAIPEGGSARGMAVGTQLNGTTLALGAGTNSALLIPVDGTGVATITGSNIMVHETGVPAVSGDYNTTFTLKFDWS